MYGKLFTQMYDGTLGTVGPWQALVTFQQLIILSDKEGVVDMTPEAISRRTTIPLDVVQVGLEKLTEPDPQSRTPDEEGRRIVLLDEHRPWGWRIVNYGHYRKIRSHEERKEYMRKYMASKRLKEKTVNYNVSMLAADNPKLPIAVSSKQYAVSNKTLMSGSQANTDNESPEFKEAKAKTKELHRLAGDILSFLNERRSTLVGMNVRGFKPVASNITPIVARLRDGHSEADCRKVIANRCMAWKDTPDMHQYLTPVTLFRPTNFEKYIANLPIVQGAGNG